MESSAPRLLGSYALLSPLAQGGMGSVFLAVRRDQPTPRSLILVKTLKAGVADAADYAARFVDEARVAVRLRHTNLCAVFEADAVDGEFFLAMELIEGITFKRLLALLGNVGERLTPPQAVALAVALLRGLHGAHLARDEGGRPLGVVHRDVSPHNVMVDVHGRVKVIDFGLATSVLKETFTESAVVLGKSAYMAPEQARGEDVTAACDQYAAAIVVYELLMGARFYGDLPSRAIWSIAGAGSHKPRDWAQVPVSLQPVLQRALDPRPAARFPSCAALAEALLAVEPTAADPGVLRSVGELVRRLKPDELDVIAAGRAAANAFEVDERRRPVEPTERIQRAAGPRAVVVDDTAATRPAAVATEGLVAGPRRQAPVLAAAAGGVVAVVVALGVVVAAVIGRGGAPATPVATPVAAVVAPTLPATPVEVVAPAAPVVPVVDEKTGAFHARRNRLFTKLDAARACPMCGPLLRAPTFARLRAMKDTQPPTSQDEATLTSVERVSTSCLASCPRP
jgi:serine/threonine-protein kinase